MALVLQGKTSNTNIGGSYSGSWYFTLSHTQASGSDGMLVVVIAASTSISLSNVRYGGVAMTNDAGWYTAPGNLQYAVFYLANPPTGANSITVDSTNNGTIAILAQSFTGAQTLIAVSHTAASNTPNSATIYANQGSMLMGIGVSQYSFADPAITIDGTGVSFGSCDISGSVSSAQLCAWTRDANLSVGTKTVITNTIAPSFQATNTRVEIRLAATATVVPQIMTNLFRIRSA